METTLQKILNNNIHLDVYKGKSWVIVDDKNKELQNLFLNLEHELIKEGKIVKNVVNKKDFKGGSIYQFNEAVVQNTLKASITEIQQQTNLPVIEPLNLLNIKKANIEAFCNYLSTLKTDKVDVLLYSSSNNTNVTLFINYKKDKYKLILKQICLNEEDIKQVNLKLSEFNKKISVIEQKDFISEEEGIRYTLYLTKADFI